MIRPGARELYGMKHNSSILPRATSSREKAALYLYIIYIYPKLPSWISSSVFDKYISKEILFWDH